MNTENAYVICRLCGYIEKASEADKPCPACGAPPTAFIPYEHKASEQRRLFLKLDIHPVTVHFTVSFTITALLLFFLSLLIPDLFGVPIGYNGMLDLLVIIIPFLVIAGGATGIADAKMRYRKLQTKLIRQKIVLGSIFFIVSIFLVISHVLSNDGTESVFVLLEAILLIASGVCTSILGWFGADLVGKIVPRGREKK